MFGDIINKMKRKKFTKVVKYNFSMVFIVIGVVMIWRSLWGFMDMYLFPDNYLYSNIASLIIWLIILYFSRYDIEDVV